MAFYQQESGQIHCEWGLQGVEALAPKSDVVIIVDVLSFSTCVEVATARGARIFPYRFGRGGADQFAREKGAHLAGRRGDDNAAYSLSPLSLAKIAAGTDLVLPSPNGSTLTLATGATTTLAGCLRNCRAVAEAAEGMGQVISVIPCGERWADESLRPALEDWLGAGAIIHSLTGSKSAEAQAAEALFVHLCPQLVEVVAACASGQELIERGFAEDVDWASGVDCSETVPIYDEGCYKSAGIA